MIRSAFRVNQALPCVLAAAALRHREPHNGFERFHRTCRCNALRWSEGGHRIICSITYAKVTLRHCPFELVLRVAARNGADLCRGRHNRRLLREAGFVRTEGYGRVVCYGTGELTHWWATIGQAQLRDPSFVATAVGQGWADQATLDAMIADVVTWGEDPDAYWSYQTPAAIGWVGQDG